MGACARKGHEHLKRKESCAMNDIDEKLEQQVEAASVGDFAKIPEADETGSISAENPEADKASEIVQASDNASEAVPETGDKPFSNAVDLVCMVVFTIAAVIVINLFLFRAISVDGTSMCDTLQDKDVVITSSFFYTPSFGDIVVIRTDKLVNSDTGQYGEPIIKRVIGVAGDTIRFDLENGEVYRNGELLNEDYIIGPTNQKHSGWVDADTDYVVPENCIFVLGDNRLVSHDSRDLNLIGFVDENYIMGKALFRLFPLGEMKWL